MKKLLITLLISISFSFVYAEENLTDDLITVVLEDGSVETRSISDYMPESVGLMLAGTDNNIEIAIQNAEANPNIIAAARIQPIYLAEVPIDVNSNDDWRFDYTKMTDMWDVISDNNYVSQDIVVAVLDTGLNMDHPDINHVDGWDFSIPTVLDDDDESDFNGHGTHVAGIIGAKRDTDIDKDKVVGVAPNVKIMPIKVFRVGAEPWQVIGTTDAIAKGIEYAIAQEVDVINMSLSYSSRNAAIETMIDAAEAAGIVVVAASSNDSNHWIDDSIYNYFTGSTYSTVAKFPSAHDTVFSVGSIVNSGDTVGISDFSNISGIRESNYIQLDIVAPGNNIYSSSINYDPTDSDTWVEVEKSGTSMASPHVAGLAALLKSNDHTLTAPQIRDIMRETAYDPGIIIPDGYDRVATIGSGLMNVKEAIGFSPIVHLELAEISGFVYDNDTSSYDFTVPFDTKTLSLTGTFITGSTLTLDGNVITTLTQSLTLNPGSNAFVISGTTGVLTQPYTLNITRDKPLLETVAFSDAGTPVTTSFDVNDLSQTVVIEAGINNITLTPAVVTSGSAFTIDTLGQSSKTYDLSSPHTIEIDVFPDDDDTYKTTYTIELLSDNDDISLENIKVNTVELADFIKTDEQYNIDVLYTEPTISAKLFNLASTLEYKIDSGSYTTITSEEVIALPISPESSHVIYLKVTSGTVYKVYEITMIRDDGVDLDNITLTYSDSSTEVFNAPTGTESDTVGYDITSVKLALTEELDTVTKTIQLNGGAFEVFDENTAHDLIIGDNTIIVRLENSTDGHEDYAKRDYTLNIHRRGNVNLDAVTVTNFVGITETTPYSTYTFDSNTLTYNVEMNETIDSIVMDFVRTDSNSNIDLKINDTPYIEVVADAHTITGLNAGVNTVLVKVTYGSEGDPEYLEKIYAYDFSLIEETDLKSLSALNIQGQTLSPVFLKTTFDYTISVANSVTSVTVEGAKLSAYAVLEIDGVEQDSKLVTLDVGANTVLLEVIAEDTTSQEYTVVITRASAPVVIPPPAPPVVTPPPVVVPPPAPSEPEDTIETVLEDGEEKTVVVVSDERIEEALLDETQTKIEIVSEESEFTNVTLDQSVLDMFYTSDKPVDVKFGSATFKLDGALLKDLKIKEQLNITYETITTVTDDKIVSQVIELDLYDGDTKIKTIQSPIPIVLDYESKNISNKKHLAVYYYDEEAEEWIYVGGKILPNNQISFEARHFSKYVIRENYKTFDDITTHWGRSYIETLASREITSGVSKTEFAPNKTLTKAEFVVLVTKVLGLPEYTGSIPYSNVKTGSWYESFFKKAHKADLLINTFQTNMDPNSEITREEMASVLMSAYFYYSDIKREDLLVLAVEFALDEGDVTSYYRESVRMSYQLGLIVGDNQNMFNPKQTATRAEAAVVIEKLLKALDLM